jgi:hypothetical protein
MKKSGIFKRFLGKAESEVNEALTHNRKESCILKKPINIIMLCMILITATAFWGCVKKHDCDCNKTGSFIYLKDTYMMSGTACNYKKEKIVAHFITDEQVLYPIKGHVPSKFRSHDTIRVNVCLKWDCENQDAWLPVDGPEIYSLKCIEEK